jgi:indole-3-glycerol phosphate synthase
VTILDEILAHKRRHVYDLIEKYGWDRLRGLAENVPRGRDFLQGLRNCPHVPIIAEIKRASPSAGSLREVSDVAALARSYEQAGAAAISVLTEENYFHGSMDDLREARKATDLPILCKDFIVHPVQIYRARLAGADAVLLIAAALESYQVATMSRVAHDLGMTALIEVHEEKELGHSCVMGASLVGINNRDLATLNVDINTSVRLRPLLPSGTLVVAESGIKGPADVLRLKAAGLDAFLVGTTLMKAPDPAEELAKLCHAGR